MLKIGDKAPDFEGLTAEGKTIGLKDYSGKKVILYFYPKDNTPGCTAQACNLRDNHDALLEKGYEVIGVSADTQKAHQKFTDKYKLPFPLIADVDKVVIKKYGVWGLKKFMGREYDGIFRTTFVISENGIIEDVITKVKTKEHSSQII